MKKTWKWILGAVVLVVTLGAGVAFMPQATNYKTENVSVETIENQYSFTGQVLDAEAGTGRLFVDERDLGKVEEGSTLTVYVSALDLELDGEINKIADEAEVMTTPGASARYAMDVDLTETDGLRNGMTLEGIIVAERVENAKTLSLDSITFENEDAYVYIEGEDGPVKQQVELGITDGSRVEVKDGLEADRVLLLDEATGGGIMPPRIGGGQ